MTFDNFVDWLEKVGRPQLRDSWDDARSVNENALRIAAAAWDAGGVAMKAECEAKAKAVDPADIKEAVDGWWTKERTRSEGSQTAYYVTGWSPANEYAIKAILVRALLAFGLGQPEAPDAPERPQEPAICPFGLLSPTDLECEPNDLNDHCGYAVSVVFRIMGRLMFDRGVKFERARHEQETPDDG